MNFGTIVGTLLLLSPMVGHDLYEVGKASVNQNEGDWRVDQVCKMVKEIKRE